MPGFFQRCLSFVNQHFDYVDPPKSESRRKVLLITGSWIDVFKSNSIITNPLEAHPLQESFCLALADAALNGLLAAGHEVR